MGIVLLETHCRFLSELRYRDLIEIGSQIRFGEGKTFEFSHTLRRRGYRLVTVPQMMRLAPPPREHGRSKHVQPPE